MRSLQPLIRAYSERDLIGLQQGPSAGASLAAGDYYIVQGTDPGTPSPLVPANWTNSAGTAVTDGAVNDTGTYVGDGLWVMILRVFAASANRASFTGTCHHDGATGNCYQWNGAAWANWQAIAVAAGIGPQWDSFSYNPADVATQYLLLKLNLNTALGRIGDWRVS